MKCSWKGRRQNFPVAKLLVFAVMKGIFTYISFLIYCIIDTIQRILSFYIEVILGYHAVTEKDLDTISAEWFRFAKQRKNREEKEN